ncbi:MAG TPA: S41 family peptidase [Pseudonocardiaceae bacterium]
MPDFRKHLATGGLTVGQRRTLVDQAEHLLDGVYVHLPLKRAMHAIDPVQGLRLIRHRLERMSDAQFHAAMLKVFVGLRDLHTNYILPSHYRGFAFLGVLIEKCHDGERPMWVVSKVFANLVGDPHLVAGVEVTHWNGVPMALAVQRNAEREAGSNPSANEARGLENMTLRPVTMSLPPDEDWVTLTYRSGHGAVREARVPWRVFETAQEVQQPNPPQLPQGISTAAGRLLGVDLRTELTRRMKRLLFAPYSITEERRVHGTAAADLTPTAEQLQAQAIPTTRPDELAARVVTTSNGTFGHLRIFSFFMADGDIVAFIEEFARLLGELPQDGLILDVRGNGGGYVIAAEFLLQFLSPRAIRPEPMQFLASRAAASLTAAVPDYEPWRASIEESIETGAQYSAGRELYPVETVNGIGQLYHGPVVLVTDALCYSATDIFAAGFQDHNIGPVLGVDDNTGAGGANVVTHADLREDWADGPFRELPGGAQFRVSLRRCLRVGERFGQPVEDLGVVPEHRHLLTRRDLLESNADLMEAAGLLLDKDSARTLRVVPGGSGLVVTTARLSTVDVYVNGRPVATTPVQDGANSVAVIPPADSVVRVEGFDGDRLVASALLHL